MRQETTHAKTSPSDCSARNNLLMSFSIYYLLRKNCHIPWVLAMCGVFKSFCKGRSNVDPRDQRQRLFTYWHEMSTVFALNSKISIKFFVPTQTHFLNDRYGYHNTNLRYAVTNTIVDRALQLGKVVSANMIARGKSGRESLSTRNAGQCIS